MHASVENVDGSVCDESSCLFINETGAIWFASLWEFFEKRIVLGHRVTGESVWRLSLKLRRQIWFMHRNAQISLTFNTMMWSPRNTTPKLLLSRNASQQTKRNGNRSWISSPACVCYLHKTETHLTCLQQQQTPASFVDSFLSHPKWKLPSDTR